MKIPHYLKEIRHAVEVAMGAIHGEQERVEHLRKELAALTAAVDDGYARVDFIARNPDLDDEGLGTAIYWDTYSAPTRIGTTRMLKSVNSFRPLLLTSLLSMQCAARYCSTRSRGSHFNTALRGRAVLMDELSPDWPCTK